MPDNNSSPPLRASPDPNAQRHLMEEKRAEWEKITARREEAIAAEKASAAERIAAGERKLERDQAAYQTEVAAEQVRHDERELWRKEQHLKHEEAERKRKQEEAEALLIAEEQQKREAAEEQQKEYMMNLHKVSVAHKIRDKRESIEDEAERQKKAAGEMADRTERQLDEETQRALYHLEAEKQRKMAQIRLNDDRRRKAIEEKARFAMIDARSVWKKADNEARRMKDRAGAGETISTARFQENQEKARIDNERRRDLLTLDEETAARLFTIEQETKHLKDEILKNAATKKLLIERQEDKRVQEAERRKDNFEKWLKES